MIAGKTVLAVIPARGGSKGIPRKNIRLIAGKPLIVWTIEQAKRSQFIDRLILSSEDRHIINIAKAHGCDVPFERPRELAQDDTPGIEPLLHALTTLPERYDYVVLLQPTSPLRTVDDIDGCITRCAEAGVVSCVSVTPASKTPYWMYTVDRRSRLTPLFPELHQVARRQDLPPVYALNGAVYVAECSWLLEHRTFIDDETTSFVMEASHSLDIDSPIDFDLCELVLKSRLQEAPLT